MKIMLYGDDTSEASPEVCEALINEAMQARLFQTLLGSYHVFEFEARKDVAYIITGMVRKQKEAVQYLASNRQVLVMLMASYKDANVSLHAGTILREFIRHEVLTSMLLDFDFLDQIFAMIEEDNFDIASDAFATLRDLLMTHKNTAAAFLLDNFDRFFGKDGQPAVSFTALLLSQNYATRRQAIKLLGDLLLDKPFYKVMTRYIVEVENLKIMMNLLRDKSKNIQYEAFHVFKVIVANPDRPAEVSEILQRNKDRLVSFLKQLDLGKEDEQLDGEKAVVVAKIEELA